MAKFGSKEIRETFLEFFTKHDHKLIRGSSIIPQNDPTLLFINSGMAPLKKYFLGTQEPSFPRLANVQPCIRTNDIEDVGDRHHLTFFEMMGSWSIGDYYKETAIELAYDLLVNYFHYSPEGLYATVYKGNPALNIAMDEESIRCWEKVGLPSDHIVPLGEDNFWGPAGDTGPCGPCTEVFFDTGEEYGPKYVPGGYFDDASRYIEIWNAGVFMELNKDKDGRYHPLPMKSVDTGSGIERMYLALNECESLYDVDTILPIFKKVAGCLSSSALSERDLRVVTDHMRTTTMLLGEGVIPEKEGRGYIARRLIRKGIAITLLAETSPFVLSEVSDEVIRQMAQWYPKLNQSRELIQATLREEIENFQPVINLGLELLDDRAAKLNGDRIPGEFVFELVATHGVPLEVISDFALKRGLKVDEEDYLKMYRDHQEISRKGPTGRGRAIVNESSKSLLEAKLSGMAETEFVGYRAITCDAEVLELLKSGEVVSDVGEGDECTIVFNETPFYAEAGGQVGDIGGAYNETTRLRITDTQRVSGVYLHSVVVEHGKLKKGDHLKLCVDNHHRRNVAKNHSATHLLHAGLRRILGTHVVQKGSLVSAKKLRFDFSHNKSLSGIEINEVEGLVNDWILDNYNADIEEMSYQEAIDSGALALFNEKYGGNVRVLRFGEVSSELCGGTHVGSTGEIGIVLITQETGIAKGIRRIEAVTGKVAYERIKESVERLKSISSLLGTSSENLIERITKLKNSAANEGSSPTVASKELETGASMVLESGEKVFIGRLDQGLDLLQVLAEKKMSDEDVNIVIMVSGFEGTVRALIMVDDDTQKTFQADNLIRRLLVPFGGKGGGRASYAKGGVKDRSKIEEIVNAASDVFQG